MEWIRMLLLQQFFPFSEREPDLLRRHADDPLFEAGHLDGLHLAPATSRFELDRPVQRRPLPTSVEAIVPAPG